MTTAQQLYRRLKTLLAEQGLVAAVEANVIYELAVGKRYLDEDPHQPVHPDAERKALELARCRRSGYPLQYLAGDWPFLDFTLKIGPGVLIPRPETEVAAQQAISLLAKHAAPDVLDLCSGSGCLAIAIARACPAARVTAVEKYPEAFAYLRLNIEANAAGVHAVRDDVYGYERRVQENSLDLIVANPPYVTGDEYRDALDELRFEPREAFVGGGDGLDFYRYIIKEYRAALRPGAIMLFETGFNQTEDVAGLFAQHDYHESQILQDDFGLPRMVLARR